MRKSLLRLNPRMNVAILLALILAISGGLFALEPPTKEQLARYRLDGTLAQRIAFAKALGNDRVEPGLLEEFKIKAERLRLKALGMSDAEIDRIMPVFPPGIRPGLRNKGNNKVFVLLIDFSDYPSSQTRDSINGKIFGDGDMSYYPYDSLRNYYRRASYNQLEILGSTLGWYRPGTTRASVAQTYIGRENLIKQALNYFDGQGHDFSQYDNDNNGVIDYFLVVWTGPPGAWASFWWGYYTGWSSWFSLDGKQFSGATYSWQWESSPYPGTFKPYVTMHETGHALGLPDLYDYDDTIGPRGEVGGLDMMAGNWADHNGFSKMLLDWLTPQVCSSGNRTYVLRPTGSHQDAVIFWPNYNIASPFTEFFMVQNRYRINNDTGLPADGLLIWHVDARLNAANDFIYDNSYTAHKLVRLMEADGLEEIERNLSANAGDYYVPGKALNKNTVPNSNAYNNSQTNAYLDTILSAGVDMSCNISFGGKMLQTAVNDASLGTTSPAPGIYTYSTGANVEVRALPVQYCAFTVWYGDVFGKDNPVIVNLDRDKTAMANFRLISPPSNLKAVRLTNRSVTQTESIVELSWDANTANAGLNIVAYRVYQMAGGSWVNLGEISGGSRTYRCRLAPKEERTYGVTSVYESGVESARTTVVK